MSFSEMVPIRLSPVKLLFLSIKTFGILDTNNEKKNNNPNP